MSWKDSFPRENIFYETENGILYNAEAIEMMSKFPEKIFDAIITDPPYGTTACKWDTIIPFDEMWQRLNKLIKPNGAIVLFGSEPFSSALRMSNIKNYRYDWIWEKHKPSNFALAKKQPMKYHELIHIFYKKQPTYNPQMIPRDSKRVQQLIDKNYIGFNTHKGELNSLKTIKRNFKKYDPNFKLPSMILKINAVQSNSKEKTIHPAQKPVALMEYLIKTYTNEGELVLDFAMGSGTTAVACEQLNRKWIGIEIEEKYCEIIKERILNMKNNKKEAK